MMGALRTADSARFDGWAELSINANWTVCDTLAADPRRNERAMNQFGYKPSYERNLPHIQPPEATLFVTFRLDGSIPEPVLEQWRIEKKRLVQEIRRCSGRRRDGTAMVEGRTHRGDC
jgi:hypothetical protein